MAEFNSCEAAWHALLVALKITDPAPSHGLVQKLSRFWQEQVLSNQWEQVGTILGSGLPHRGNTPICVGPVAIHMVCPHHFTIATGKSWVGYVPQGKVVGFGRLVHAMHACCARVALQEQVAQDLPQALVTYLQARSAMAYVVAQHPCCALLQPSSCNSQIATWGQAQTSQALPEQCREDLQLLEQQILRML